MKKWIVCLVIICGLLSGALLHVYANLNEMERTNDAQRKRIQVLESEIKELKAVEPIETVIYKPYTRIFSTDKYNYLENLVILTEKYEKADKLTDINGVKWFETVEDGMVTVYAEGHIMPDQIHWYAPY
jgi:5-bromo-4-chloroindolyl phosphate hydrolysis protein